MNKHFGEIKVRKNEKWIPFLIFLGITLALSTIINNNFNASGVNNEEYLENNNGANLRSSEFWNLTGTPIFIDDSEPIYNWSKTAADNEWCNGNGTWDDPYIIENVTINGLNSSSCIEVRNSNAYFVIRNCTIFNSSDGEYDAGIKLNNTNNGQLINNNCSFNNRHGIHLLYSNYTLILENSLNINSMHGLRLFNSENNTISSNNAFNNGQKGIALVNSNNNTALENNASNNNDGIYLYHCVNNIISKNTVKNNSDSSYSCGISLMQSSHYNLISDI